MIGMLKSGLTWDYREAPGSNLRNIFDAMKS